MSQDETAAQVVKQGMSLLDRATEFRFCLLFVALILTTDIYFGWAYGANILTFDWTAIKARNFGELLLVLAGFFLYMGLLSPFIQYVFDKIVSALYYSNAAQKLRTDTESSRRPSYGMVTAYALRDRALRENNAFEYKLYTDARHRWARIDEEEGQIARVSFSCGGLLLVDACTQKSIVRWLWQATPTTFHGFATWIVPLVVAFLFIYPWLSYAWSDRYAVRWIDYPPLAEELERKRREQDVRRNSLI